MNPVSLIAALSRNGVIGRNNQLPWRIPEDLRRFRQLTTGHPVLMGRKTYESIVRTLGGPLPGRENIVLTRSLHYQAPGCRVAHSVQAALDQAHEAAGAEEVFVIGGAELYRLLLPVAQHLYLTEIHAEFEGDAWFPPFSAREWRETSREPRQSPQFSYDFVTYERCR
jgi:dihydrofolate reductase